MSADRVVGLVCAAIAILLLGYEIGVRNRPAQCPFVAGQTVISTTDDHGAQYCTYASSYARVITRRKL